jgi:hypothetical protein
MTFCQSIANQVPDEHLHERLVRTSLFTADSVRTWTEARLGIVGAGAIGGRVAHEAVLSGIGSVAVWDFDVTEPGNLWNQFGDIGVAKVDGLVRRCDMIRPGRVTGHKYDVRHTGIRPLLDCDLLIDCSDDPGLVWTLSEISNGIGLPYMRAAVDGSGLQDMGRVACWRLGLGSACPICPYSPEDLQRSFARTPCPAATGDERPPTLAGSAISSVIAGYALHQAQRLIAGTDDDRVIDRELLVDMTNGHFHEIQLPPSASCLSGHRHWDWLDMPQTVNETTLADVFALAQSCLEPDDLCLAAYQHPLNDQAVCNCGASTAAFGSAWAEPPICGSCGRRMQWLGSMQRVEFDEAWAAEVGILRQPLSTLGLPPGVMFVARDQTRILGRILLH